MIDVPTLASLIAGSDPPTVLDIRWRLAAPPTRNDYLDGHIPGAVFVDLDGGVCGPPGPGKDGPGGRHPLPDPASLQRVLRAAGVRAGHPVVVYDAGTGEAGAARLWWTLRWAGHPAVRVLDGGYPAWVAAGRPVEPGEVVPAPGDITVVPGGMPVLDAPGAADRARHGVLLDARVPARYRGEVEPVDGVAGHIPGAVNLPTGELTTPNDRLRDPAQLRARFAAAGVDERTQAGAYCGSGVTAALTVLAANIAGLPQMALYVGSWSDWITDDTRPVETGPVPTGAAETGPVEAA